MTSGLDVLGAENDRPSAHLYRVALSLAVGGVSALLIPSHRVLAFLGGTALASNAHAVLVGERPLKNAVKRIGKHAVAVAGSLALPKHPAIGYVAGAVAADLLVGPDGDGFFDEWGRYTGVVGRARVTP